MLLSRVANACYWLSRYQERAEFTARIVDVNLVTLLDTSHAESDWEPIVRINGCEDHFVGNINDMPLSHVLDCLALDPTNSNSILSCIRTARENARQAREQISSEMWEQINDLYHMMNGLTLDSLGHTPHNVLQTIKNGTLLLQGLSDQTMMHGEGWRFIQLGRFLERANTTCRLLLIRSDARYFGQSYRDVLHWVAVLKSASSLEAYHKTYAAPVTTNTAIEFLLLNEESPRSILYCLENVLGSLRYVSGQTGQRFGNESERLSGRLSSALHYLRMEDIELISYLREIQSSLAAINDSITSTYFSYEVA